MTEKETEALAHSLKATLLQTHISWVLLTDTLVYKIKKPLKLSFLDFSTAALRKKYCLREVALNKPLAGSMYKKTEAIKKQGDRFVIGGKTGKTVDYAVVMKRMDRAREMNVLLEANKVSLADIRHLARRVAAFHKKAPRKRKQRSCTEWKNDFNDLYVVLAARKNFFSPAEYQRLLNTRNIVTTFIDSSCDLLEEQARKGLVRDVHGDLHSGNIFIYDKPVIFDRIEFNERFRQVDILQEVSFLSMDVEAHGFPELAKEFLKTYFSLMKLMPDNRTEQLIHFYKSYSANIRAKVTLMAIGNPGIRETKIQLKKIKTYLRLMQQYIRHLDIKKK